MYRGQDLKNREKLIQTCLEIFESGNESKLFEVLPHIGIVRSPAFVEPLIRLLKSGNRNQKEFAALALGSLEDRRCIEPLYVAFAETAQGKQGGNHALRTAIIVALGESGSEEAVEPLLKIYHRSFKPETFAFRRKRLVLAALGALAQQGIQRAEEELIGFLKDQSSGIRAQAVMELSVAYWHRPNEIADSLLERIFALTEERSATVRNAALSSLSNLADLGCRAAEAFFEQPES